MSDYCDETCPVWREKIVKARKPHKCSACRTEIRQGDYYSYTFSVFDGEPGTTRRCGACELIYQHLRELCSKQCDYAPFADLGCGKTYEEEWGELPDEIAALAFMPDGERGTVLSPQPKAKP